MLCGFNHRGFGELGRARATLRQPTARPMTSEHCTTLHNLTPAEFAPCCRHCIAGMNHDSGHIVKVKRDFAEVLALQCDHPFFSCDGQLVETDSLLTTASTATNTFSGWPLMKGDRLTTASCLAPSQPAGSS